MRKFPRKFRLTHSFFSQLHSGDLGALSGLLKLEKVDLYGCRQITGKELSSTLLADQSVRKFPRKFRFTHSFFGIHNSFPGDKQAIKQALP